jgi:hypothetical protein
MALFDSTKKSGFAGSTKKKAPKPSYTVKTSAGDSGTGPTKQAAMNDMKKTTNARPKLSGRTPTSGHDPAGKKTGATKTTHGSTYDYRKGSQAKKPTSAVRTTREDADKPKVSSFGDKEKLKKKTTSIFDKKALAKKVKIAARAKRKTERLATRAAKKAARIKARAAKKKARLEKLAERKKKGRKTMMSYGDK